ncbi:MAG: peptide deformylase [Eubacteriales bacterium]|nr:peptide deformylase [Eubacteriales bacterium]
MERKICRDLIILSQKAVPATKEDAALITDLLDTLKANADRCVGLACNMIGVPKAIIAISDGPFRYTMVNPVITKKSKPYETEEGCLSLDGVRPCLRFDEIEVDYETANFVKKHAKFTGYTAEIIQHECDHLNGIII